MTIDKYYNITLENTLPILFYILGSFFVFIITDLRILIIQYVLFLIVSGTLFSFNVIKKNICWTIVIFLLISIMSSAIDGHISYSHVGSDLSKGLSLSVIIITSINLFYHLSTFQLLLLIKLLTKSNQFSYALLSGFRSFTIFSLYSKRIVFALKIRGVSRHPVTMLLLYLKNIIIEFFTFLDEFIIRLMFLDIQIMSLFKNEYKKLIISILYFSCTIVGAVINE